MVTEGATGRLNDWVDLEDEFLGASLLLGNGFSTHVAADFAYGSLMKQADKLDDRDQELFDALETSNFESVLEALSMSLVVAQSFDLPTDELEDSYERIQGALGSAVRAVHIEWRDVEPEVFQAIQDELVRYQAVFTTSYDLLLYWAMGHEDGYSILCDCFWGPNSSFDPDDCGIAVRRIPVYYMHGALHLVARGDGRTRKNRKSLGTLLEKFGRPIASDPLARPLLVTEGASRHKLRVIDANDYLTFCRRALVGCDDPIVAYGFAFGEQDRHIAEALNQYPGRPVAISMRSGIRTRSALRARQNEIAAMVHADEIYFYDANTHPLGNVPRASA